MPFEPSFQTRQFHDLKDLFSFFNKSAHYGRYVWRGESSSNYSLIPSAFREDISIPDIKFGMDDSTEYVQINKEFLLLREFYTIADRRGLSVPKVDFIEGVSVHNYDLYNFKPTQWLVPGLYDIAGLAQHYGVATRLLDWTYDFYTALYFACIGAIKREYEERKKGNKINDAIQMVVWRLEISTIELFDYEKQKIRIIKPPYFGNPNLSAQAGLFTFWKPEIGDFSNLNVKTDKTPFNELVLKNSVYGHTILWRYLIPFSERFKIYYLIKNIGWDASKLFPSYDGVKKSMDDFRIVKTLK